MSNVLLISAPAAGKGVTAKYLKDKYNLVHMSIGNLLREESEINPTLKEILKNGEFADNNIVYDLFSKFIDDNKNSNFVFEGFPRLIEQIKPFEEILNTKNINIDKIIFISIDKEIAEKRVSGRLMCKNCNEIYNKYFDDIDDMKCKKCNSNLSVRDDDKLSTYENRYKLFIENTIPVIEYFRKNYEDRFYEVSNNGSIDETYNQIDRIMDGD